MTVPSVSSGDALELIREIRTHHGFDDNGPLSGESVRGLRGMLERALERLSSDLYNKKTHFLLEFIQNADDNSYNPNVAPALHLRVEDRLVVFECNEEGFSAANVNAICDIGASTKRERTRGFIGEKGIGFKSVFTVADQVHISSGPYIFHFDRNEQLGMITPVNGSAYPVRPGWTTFHLRLSPSESGAELSTQLRDVRPTLLLFLRQLRALSVNIAGASIQVRRTDDPEHGMACLERVEGGVHKEERFILVRHVAQTPTGQSGRENIKESEIVLAFPVTEAQDPVLERQNVHAFLPLRCYGFHFIIQADFITSASREDILEDRPWNISLRNSVVDAFILAIERFLQHPKLRDTWFRYLPEAIADSFFMKIEHLLFVELWTRSVLRSSDDTYVCGHQLLTVPSAFSDDWGAPLIPESSLPKGKYYLSLDYDALGDARYLQRLGVCDMTEDQFLDSLAIMDKARLFDSQSEAWHDAVATCMLAIARKTPMIKIPAKLAGLHILPLRDGTWAAAVQAGTLTFSPSGVNVPDDLGLQSIAHGISVFSPRYQLFLRLGVLPPNPVYIANKILQAAGPRSIAARVTHARFFFEHRNVHNMLPASRLRLVDEHGVGAQSDELYLDIPAEDGALRLRDALSPTARFLHPDYLTALDGQGDSDDEDAKKEWLPWLRDHVGVNAVPRILPNGHLAPEFAESAHTLPGRPLLASLRAWWQWLGPRLSESGRQELAATSVDGRRLDTLYLRRAALALSQHEGELPCVPVDDPEDRGWDFLAQLGVVMRIGASYFVNRLVHMQANGEKDREPVEEAYRQLDARFHEDEALIRKAFSEYPIILVYANAELGSVWLRKVDVFWHGPPSMTSKAIISRTYPRMSDFFFSKLGITNAPPYALVDELRLIAQRQHGALPTGVREHVADILADLSDAVAESGSNVPTSFLALADIAAFPVSVPGEGIVLRAAEGFYVPDKAGKYADVFRERVGLLALPESTPISRIRPLLESDIFKDRMRYMESEVTKRSVPQGMRILDTAATDLYSSRVGYIARLVHHSKKAEPTSQQITFFVKLRNISVIGVESINTTLTLGVCRESTPEPVSVQETEDKFTVFVSRTGSPGGHSIDPIICEALARLLEVDMIGLFTCITQTTEMVDRLFGLKGIEELAVDDGHDRSWLQAISQPHVPVVPVVPAAPPQRTPSPSPPPVQAPRSPSPSTLSVHDTQHFPPLSATPARPPRRATLSPSQSSISSMDGRSRQRSWEPGYVGVTERSQFRQPPPAPAPAPPPPPPPAPAPATALAQNGGMRDMGRLAAHAEPFLNGQQMVPGPLGPLVLPPYGNFNAPMQNEETDMVGIMGEHHVYRTLVRMLDDFGPDNWTSELRHCVPGFTRFRGSAYADFTYLDSRGQLTAAWLGPERAAAWHGRWPRYHIEVKSTRGEEGEPFHMSRNQMLTASAFAERYQLGTDFYVLVRVSRIGMQAEPAFSVYADPHRALFAGQLQYATDVYLQRNI
ncbi:hypothetical protein BC834DRAFT_901531 [Gloeopeniophorella convolvens]|nr:hypothetical protein BC834DRAFT_901531 [Gloeopeniophorella convolvens]